MLQSILKMLQKQVLKKQTTSSWATARICYDLATWQCLPSHSATFWPLSVHFPGSASRQLGIKVKVTQNWFENCLILQKKKTFCSKVLVSNLFIMLSIMPHNELKRINVFKFVRGAEMTRKLLKNRESYRRHGFLLWIDDTLNSHKTHGCQIVVNNVVTVTTWWLSPEKLSKLSLLTTKKLSLWQP